jgi:ribosome modulation factor
MGRPVGSKNKTNAPANGQEAAPRKAGRKQAAAGTPRPARTETPPERKKTNGPTPERNAGWLAELEKLETRKASLSGEFSALKERVKSGDGDWMGLKEVRKLKRLEPAEATARLDSLLVLARQNEIKVTWFRNQAAFSDFMETNQPPPKNTAGSRDLAAARAHGDGYNSGRNGAVPHENPFNHAPGSEEYVQWLKGRDDGQLDRELNTPGMADRIEASRQADGTIPDAPLF